jgi:hypothetical protein
VTVIMSLIRETDFAYQHQHQESICKLEGTAVRFLNRQPEPDKACLLKIVHNVLGPYISERPDLPFPKFSELCECKMISGCPAVLV